MPCRLRAEEAVTGVGRLGRRPGKPRARAARGGPEERVRTSQEAFEGKSRGRGAIDSRDHPFRSDCDF